MDTDSPQTPDVDLPGQEHDQADLDIVVEPEPGTESDQADGATGGSPDEPAGADASADPALGNTLIRPDNS
jgi:hypothetical protein